MPSNAAVSAAGPASAPASGLGKAPAVARRARYAAATDHLGSSGEPGGTVRTLLPRRTSVQLAAAASRGGPLGRRQGDRLSPILDSAPTPTGLSPVEGGWEQSRQNVNLLAKDLGWAGCFGSVQVCLAGWAPGGVAASQPDEFAGLRPVAGHRYRWAERPGAAVGSW